MSLKQILLLKHISVSDNSLSDVLRLTYIKYKPRKQSQLQMDFQETILKANTAKPVNSMMSILKQLIKI